MGKRHIAKRRRYEHGPKQEEQPGIYVNAEAGDVVLSPRMSQVVSLLVKGALEDGHMSTEQKMCLTGLTHTPGNSHQVGMRLSVDELMEISGLSEAILKGYESRPTYCGRFIGPRADTGLAAREFNAAQSVIPQTSIDAARERASEKEIARQEVATNVAFIALDEYTVAFASAETSAA